jgi:hypothetical protein
MDELNRGGRGFKWMNYNYIGKEVKSDTGNRGFVG